MGITRRSCIDILAKAGCVLAGLALGSVHLAQGLVVKRVRFAQPDNVFPGRRKDLLPRDVKKPSHWLG